MKLNKLIGFLITKEDISLNIDIFEAGLKLFKIKHNEFYIYFWGINNIKNCIIENKYSFSFPLTKTLLDRNILIKLDNESIVIENDWLGSIPVFYNKQDEIVSTVPSFCLKDKVISKEGLLNYSQFGYSAFGQTSFKNVKFLRYYSTLTISNWGIINEEKEDIINLNVLSKTTNTNDVLKNIKQHINTKEKQINKNIILPISGGFDSRILASMLENKEKVTAFTYGISEKQNKSFEVVHAKKVSEILNIKWQQIELKEYNKYINDWYKIYGFSTHTHGMYHIEFYKNILKERPINNSSFLSGIVGDAWAGSIPYTDISIIEDINKLSYSHNMSVDKAFIINNINNNLKKDFFDNYQQLLKNEKYQIITIIRFKIVLLSYLCQIPEYFGIPVWTPFLNYELVINILNLPKEERLNRKWQKDYFTKCGLNIEDMELEYSKNNDLNYKLCPKIKVSLLDVNLMKKYYNKNRLTEINLILENMYINNTSYNKEVYLKALFDYYTIIAIQKGIKNVN